jgi:O-antigen/teichoic acid export membrane protein
VSSLKQIIKSNKTIIENFSYLSLLQVFNMVVPLFTYPYIINVLGIDIYGRIIFAQAFIGYFVILINFGFNISATKEVSIHRDNKEKLNEIVSSIFIIKFFLLLISVFSFIVIMHFTDLAENYELLFYITLYLCFIDWLFPIWYFQGIQKMKYITFINVISRTAFLVLIFVLIKKQEDYLFFPIINAIGGVISILASLFFIFYKDQIKFLIPAKPTLIFYFKESIPIFISNVSVNLYASSSKFIIGIFLGMNSVAFYDLAEKLITLLRAPQGILSQTIFPKISREKDIGFVKKVFKISVWVNIGIYLVFLTLLRPIVVLLGGEEMLPAIPVTIILGLTIPITAMSNIFGIQLLLPFGYNREFSIGIVTSGFIYLALIILTKFIFGFSIENISLITVLTELFVTILMFNYCLKFNLWKKNTITSL